MRYIAFPLRTNTILTPFQLGIRNEELGIAFPLRTNSLLTPCKQGAVLSRCTYSSMRTNSILTRPQATCGTLLTSVYKLPFLAMKPNANIEPAAKGCVETGSPQGFPETRERSSRLKPESEATAETKTGLCRKDTAPFIETFLLLIRQSRASCPVCGRRWALPRR